LSKTIQIVQNINKTSTKLGPQITMSLQLVQHSIESLAKIDLPPVPTIRQLVLTPNENPTIRIAQRIDFNAFSRVEPAFTKVTDYYMNNAYDQVCRTVIVDDKYLWCFKFYAEGDGYIRVRVFDAYTEEYLYERRIDMTNTTLVNPYYTFSSLVLLMWIHHAKNGSVWLVYRFDRSGDYFAALINKDFIMESCKTFENETQEAAFLVEQGVVSSERISLMENLLNSIEYQEHNITKHMPAGNMFYGTLVCVIDYGFGWFKMALQDSNFIKIIQINEDYNGFNFMLRGDGALFTTMLNDQKFYRFV